jgi:CelD/BcsL family acetyltransferase involved in cellulose biosynthesis
MAVIRMNQARMAGKDKVSSYDEAESQRLCRLARVCGLVGLLVLDGHICAGAVSFRVGSNYFMSLSAHDPGYDEYRLGTLSGFLNISECIRRGGRECHLLWGQHDYKFRFLGVERALDNLTVYRSLPAMLRNMETVLTMSAQGNMRRLQRWLQEARRNEALPWRAASLLEMFWRRARRQLGSRSVPPVLPEALQNGLPEQEQN